jgi:hypothetical protein
VDAVRYFVSEIWPAVLDFLPEDAKFYVVGPSVPAGLRELANDRIVFTGYVERLEPVLNRCRVFVAPLRYGAGLKGKVVTALSHGVPCVATSTAIEGMGLRPDEHVLTADDPISFANQVRRLYHDPVSWQKQQEAGYAFVSERYSWDAGSKVAKHILEVAKETWFRRHGEARKARIAALRDHAGATESCAAPRPVILHYHLFKNAGTSLDRTLRANFGATWDSHEGLGEEWLPHEVREFLFARPWLSVLSSHNAVLPAPRLPGSDVIPVIFVRHPLDRIRSIYDFERKQPVETSGAQTAKNTDLSGYIRWRLARTGDRAIANFQTYRLAKGGVGDDELSRTMNAIQTLPFVGLVEAYERSLERLQELLEPRFPRIKLAAFHVNVTKADEVPLEGRLEELRARIGDSLYAEIEAANQNDMVVWHALCKVYEAEPVS